MKKLLAFVDLTWVLLVPLIACGYLVFHQSQYAGHILLYGWILYLVHAMLNLALFRSDPPVFPLTLSLLSGIGLIVCVITDYISLREFLIIELIGESVSIVGAVMIFLLFKKGIDGKSAWKSLGPGIVILNLIIFSATAYPFIQEWLLMLEETQQETFYWLGSAGILLVAIYKKVGVIGSIVKKRNLNISKKNSEVKDEGLDKKLDNKPWPVL
ncbi:MAG: hypothetical protein HUJ25_02965, partial [Crocinitomicaceae bacterium]|nr:hypothetical protein [Crocinitomicaceae bacterium]